MGCAMYRGDEMWRYEIWDEQKLIDMRRKYFTENEAEEAGRTALRAIQDITPGRELKLVTETDG